MDEVVIDEPAAVVDFMRRAVESENPDEPLLTAFEDHDGHVELLHSEALIVYHSVQDYSELWMDYGILKRKALRALMTGIGDYQKENQ